MSPNRLDPLYASAGANTMEYVNPAYPDRPIVLHSARPKEFGARTPVVFVHHGAARNGGDYRDHWLPFVDAIGVIAIAPEFPEASFPGTSWYNFGALTDDAGAARPRASWTFAINAQLFAALRVQGLTVCASYGMFGHSAGGQFVHRLLSLGFRDNVAIAISANAGHYGMPDLETAFPYGLGGIGLGTSELAAMLRFPSTVMAGTADTDTTGPAFPREPEAMAQGANRYERAQNYLAAGRAQAARLGVAFGWIGIDVPGVGYDGAKMTEAAAPVVAAALHAAAARQPASTAA
jgi:hypothetical protein